jgi:hypothetical protein
MNDRDRKNDRTRIYIYIYIYANINKYTLTCTGLCTVRAIPARNVSPIGASAVRNTSKT